MKITSRLEKDHIKEAYGYIALHDAKVHKKMVSLLIGLWASLFILVLIVFNLSWTSLGLGIGIIGLLIILFPRIYYKMVFDRLDNQVENTPVNISKLEINLEDVITVNDGKNKVVIQYNELSEPAFTQNTCILFYTQNKITNTLIVPLSQIENQEEFIELLKEKLI